MKARIDGTKAGSLYTKQQVALANARERLLRLCGAQDHNLPEFKVRFCGDATRRASKSELVFDGDVYELINTYTAKPTDPEGDAKLICYRAVAPGSRQTTLFVFTQ